MPAYTRCPDCQTLNRTKQGCVHRIACDQCGNDVGCANAWVSRDHRYCSDRCLTEAGLERAADEAPEAWERAL